MKETLLFLLLGLGTGATIAAIAVGIVVTYRGSGFINLAAGAIAMLAGFSFWALRTGELGFTLATPLAIALTYVFVSVVSIAIELAVFRPLRTARRWRSSSPRSASCSRRRRRCCSRSGPRSIPSRPSSRSAWSGCSTARCRCPASCSAAPSSGSPSCSGRSTAGRASGSRRARRRRTTSRHAWRVCRRTSSRSRTR